MSEEDQEDKKFPFDIKFQVKVLKLMIDNPAILSKCIKLVKPNYFETKALSWVFTKIVDYYLNYNKIITLAVFLHEIQSLGMNENQLEYLYLVKQVTEEKLEESDYVRDKLEEFIKSNVFIRELKSAVAYYNSRKFDMAMDEVNKCVNEVNNVNFRDLHRVDFIDSLADRVCARSIRVDEIATRFTTGVLELDARIGGGVGRGELFTIGADSGKGKSIWLANIAVSNVKSGSGKVLLVNLEGTDHQLMDRLDARFLNKNYHDVCKNNIPLSLYSEYTSENYKNVFKVCHLHDKFDHTVIDIDNEINELKSHNFKPDVLVVDYGDLLTPRGGLDKSNTYLGQEQVYRDLTVLGNKHNCAVFTASQLHRPSKDDNINDPAFVLTRKNVADCYSKIRVSSFFVTLNQTETEKQQKIMRLYLDKARSYEDGSTITIHTDYDNMQFYKPQESSFDSLVKKTL